MLKLQIREGSHETDFALCPGRSSRLKRAKSFQPDELSSSRRPRSMHTPIHRCHRTMPELKLPYAYPFEKRTASNGHIPESCLNNSSSENFDLDVPGQDVEIYAESTTTEDTSYERYGTNVGEIAFDTESLCEKCRGVNIESMSAEGGYVHLTLDVIKAQSDICTLCKVLIESQKPYLGEEALDRKRIVLSLKTERVNRSNSGHFVSGPAWEYVVSKLVCISTFSTRLHELPDCTRGRVHQTQGSDDRPQAWRSDSSSIRERTILCYTDENDPARQKGVPWLRNIGKNTGSIHSLHIARSWLEEYLATESQQILKSAYSDESRWKRKSMRVPPVDVDHAWSVPERTPMDQAEDLTHEGPTRLLSIVDPSDIQGSRVHLIKTHGTVYSYATLSYCWGRSGDEWLCNTHNLDRYLCDIDRKSLPATIHDCIVIAANLGIRYIWIDALCIIQDSDSDWATESAKMGGIYHGSLLTIAAAASSHSNGGCFNKTSRPRFSEDISKSNLSTDLKAQYPRSDLVGFESALQDGSKSRLYFVTGKSDPYYFAHDDVYGQEVIHGPLARRAWVFQEQMLSRRIIYYARSQLFWECEHCRLSEDNWPQRQAGHIYPIIAYEEPMSTAKVVEKWYMEAVETYSARSLSRVTDKLVAISAAAKATYSNRRIGYFAGLWKDCIMAGLLWTRNGPGRKSRRYACPSWSWASQETRVSYRHIEAYRQSYNSPHLYQPKIVDVHVETDPTNPFGDVKGGYIKLDTLVTTGWVMRQDPRLYPLNKLYREFIFSTPGRNDIWSSSAIMDDDDHQGSKLTVAFLGNNVTGWRALLLEPMQGEAQQYRRVGMLVPKSFFGDTIYTLRGIAETVKTAPLWMDSGFKPQRITIV